MGLKTGDGDKSKAAALLRVKRSTLSDRIQKLGLEHLKEPVMQTGATGRE